MSLVMTVMEVVELSFTVFLLFFRRGSATLLRACRTTL